MNNNIDRGNYKARKGHCEAEAEAIQLITNFFWIAASGFALLAIVKV